MVIRDRYNPFSPPNTPPTPPRFPGFWAPRGQQVRPKPGEKGGGGGGREPIEEKKWIHHAKDIINTICLR